MRYSIPPLFDILPASMDFLISTLVGNRGSVITLRNSLLLACIRSYAFVYRNSILEVCAVGLPSTASIIVLKVSASFSTFPYSFIHLITVFILTLSAFTSSPSDMMTNW